MHQFLIACLILIGAVNVHAQSAAVTYVTVTGYESEKVPGYFDDYSRFVEEKGAGKVQQIRPLSETAVLENAKMLHSRLLEIFENGGRKPLVILAHSKGGLELFHALVRNAGDFPASVVKAAVILQSPLGGAIFVDHLLSKYDFSVVAMSPLYWMYRSQHQGALSMATPQVLQDLNESEKLLDRAHAADLSSRIFYVRSRQKADAVSPALKKYAQTLAGDGDNDGLVLTASEKIGAFAGLAQFGTDLGVLDCNDHLDFVSAGAKPVPERIEKNRRFAENFLRFTQDPRAPGGIRGEPVECSAVFVRGNQINGPVLDGR